ncbi:claudin-11 [Anolis sagrei]|uniref:Claudin n=1 Tax=Anolis carolinensis TaxID=28377 RepID=G1KS09_ANOCA|nr:PREDICTED: claudin-11 [Anolis carolinensis]XP_060623516.1 claudin-11 [Anolis sagrei ordinatus]|eukprot:XP_003218185.1 PREDICTED: claudin-11 [Anolis carolinensis]
MVAGLHMTGFLASFVGWIGLIVATATNDWVVTCGYTIPTCRKMDELGSKGLWADCVMATGLYHCKPLVDILILPGYVQACRALMIAAAVLGLPAVLLLVTVLPCIRIGHEPGVAKYRRSQLGGILLILVGLCGIVATIWFPVSAHRETTIMSFGYSLYTGWIGAALALLGGCIIVCCSGDAQSFGENRYYASGSSSPTHAKSAHV